ncbi:MAG TPA: hypothetical protein PKA27_02445, partial [Fimbriimonadaceae bacterium]|nr:hypothetical protein [Fimbriimonadaceae bacterium]
MAKSLYVGNLSYSTTESELLQHFAPFGATGARVVEGRGFGFIDIPDENLNAAIDGTHDKEFMGRKLRVNEAEPKRPRDFGGGGGGGGGYGGGRGGGG